MDRLGLAARRAWNLSFVGTLVAAVAVFPLGVGDGDAILQVLTVAALLCVTWALFEPERPARS